MTAFVQCYKTGIYIHENVREIRIKKHGRKAKSIFKCGLLFIASALLDSRNQIDTDLFFVMIFTLAYQIRLQIQYSELTYWIVKVIESSSMNLEILTHFIGRSLIERFYTGAIRI